MGAKPRRKPAVAAAEKAPPPKRPVTVVLLLPTPRRKRYLGLWLGIPAGVIAVTAAVCAAILIAPGVTAAGVEIGGRTPGAASALVAEALAETAITLETSSGDVTLSGDELGLSVDAAAVSELAYRDHPAWRVGSWNPAELPIEVHVDAEVATAAINAAVPGAVVAPVPASVRFNAKLAQFVTVPATPGLGVDLDELTATVSDALSAGDRAVTVDATRVALPASVSTDEAKAEAMQLNALIGSAGFYVDGTRVVTVDPVLAASWISVDSSEGTLAVDVDEAAAMGPVSKIVAGLRKTLDHAAVNEIIVTNSAGEHLRTVQAGVEGWKLGSTTGVAAGFIESFAAGDGHFELSGTDVPFETTLSMRTIEVNKSTGQTILYENGKVVASFPVAIGKSSTPTPDGHFTIFWQLPTQDMGCVPGYDYCTPDVPWVSYFSGDNAFHGTYWHDNFGQGAMMSHGCVNMTIPDAERLYYWAQEGTEVWVHP